MSLRDELRSAAFKNPDRLRIPFKFNEKDFELLSPTVAQRREILKRSKRADAATPTILDMQEWTAIFCTVVPGTCERVFEETDHGSFEEMSMGGFLDTVGSHTFSLLNLTSEKEQKQDAKASEETTI
jgi:hypothetical protein